MSTATASRSYVNDSVIDGTSAATSTVETTITQEGVDRRFHCLIADAVPVEVDNVLEGPFISIGTNSPNYNNIVSSQLLDTLGIGNIFKLNISANLAEIPEGTEIKCKVVYAATPIPFCSPTFTFKVTLFGVDHLY